MELEGISQTYGRERHKDSVKENIKVLVYIKKNAHVLRMRWKKLRGKGFTLKQTDWLS